MTAVVQAWLLVVVTEYGHCEGHSVKFSAGGRSWTGVSCTQGVLVCDKSQQVVLICVVKITIAAQMIAVSPNYMNYRVINLSASYDLPLPTATPPRAYVVRLNGLR
jgi:hypothetical protein